MQTFPALFFELLNGHRSRKFFAPRTAGLKSSRGANVTSDFAGVSIFRYRGAAFPPRVPFRAPARLAPEN